MLVHFRVTAPADLARDILRRWLDDPRLIDVVHLPGAVRPSGDLLEADVAREAASDILEQLDRAGVRERRRRRDQPAAGHPVDRRRGRRAGRPRGSG